MPLRNTPNIGSKNSPSIGNAQSIRVRFKALEIPPIKDGVVIGRRAPISVGSMLETLKLVSNERFTSIDVMDDVIGEIVVREALLRKVETDTLKRFVVDRIKPSMAETELLSLYMEIEIVMEDIL